MKRILSLLFILHSSFFILHSFAQEKVILLNEGNWQADNGRLTYFENGAVVSNQWFRDKNGYKLGDTPNDIIQLNDNLIAIALNWSNIIQFIRPDGKAVAATEDVPNNRAMATDGKYLYVTSYGHECGDPSRGFYKSFTKGYVAKIDLSTYKIIDAVEVGYEPDGIALYKGYLFVVNTGGYSMSEGHDYEQTVSVVNASTMKIDRTIDTGVINMYGKVSQSGRYLLINSPGDYYNIAACSLVFDCEKAISGQTPCYVKLGIPATYSTATLDGKFLAIGSAFSYNTYGYEFSQATIDPAFVMASNGANGVDTSLPGTMASKIASFTSPYCLYVNPYTGYIYATDASSYADGGRMYQWDSNGNLKGSWKVYINPGHILALPPDGHLPTAVDNAVATRPNSGTVYYNTQGQRVNKSSKGLVISGNKKILNK